VCGGGGGGGRVSGFHLPPPVAPPPAPPPPPPGVGDPLLNIFYHRVLGGVGGLAGTLSEGRLHPSAARALLHHVADCCASILEEGWWREGQRVSEYGALLQQAQLREIRDALISLAPSSTCGGEGSPMSPGAAATIRTRFAPLGQSVSILLRVEKALDLYTLTFPKKLLSKAQVMRTLAQKVGLGLANIDWERVQCI